MRLEDEQCALEAAELRASAKYMAPEERERIFGPDRALMSSEDLKEVFGPWDDAVSEDECLEMEFSFDGCSADPEPVDIDFDFEDIMDDMRGLTVDVPNRRGSPDYTLGGFTDSYMAGQSLENQDGVDRYAPYHLGGYSVDPRADFQVCGL